ncbi:hypothetical protein [Nitrospira sp. Nam80]
MPSESGEPGFLLLSATGTLYWVEDYLTDQPTAASAIVGHMTANMTSSQAGRAGSSGVLAEPQHTNQADLVINHAGKATLKRQPRRIIARRQPGSAVGARPELRKTHFITYNSSFIER